MKLKLILFLLLGSILSAAAQDTLLLRMEQLREKYDIRFIYDSTLRGTLEQTRELEALTPGLTLEEALSQSFRDSALSWEKRGRSVILRPAAPAPKAIRMRRVTISGHITDAASGETLIGAGVLSGQTGAVTNEFGFYTLTLPAGAHTLQVAYLGFNPLKLELDLQRDTTLNFSLSGNTELEAARIVSRKDAGLQSVYPGSLEVPLRQIQATPALLGEADVLKSLQLLPGIQSGMQGFTGLHVRGGGPEENLVMLDGVPIYGINHLLGLFSVFQPEAVKDITLFKGAFPARYGGRISSVVDVRTREGNMKETTGSFTVGTTSERFHIEGPIVKDRLSYSVSARALHSLLLSPFLTLAMKNSEEKGNSFYYDFNARLSWIASERDRVYLILYHGNDHLRIDGQYEYNREGMEQEQTILSGTWGNTVAALRWNHLSGNRLHVSTTASFNRYGTGLTLNNDHRLIGETIQSQRFDLRYDAGIRDLGIRTDFDWTPSPAHLVKFGAGWTHHLYRPAVMDVTEMTDGNVQKEYRLVDNDRYPGMESFLYAEDNLSLGEHLSLNPGIHLAWFRTQGRNYLSLQPRMSVRYAPGGGWSVKAGYARMAQYVHQLTASTLTLPLDLWVPITAEIPPVTSDQYTVGLYWDGLPGWEFSIEGYLKQMDHLLAYRDGSLLILNSNRWEEQIAIGSGSAKGIEFYAAKTRGKTTGSLSYTLAKSTRIFPDGSVNLGREFPDKYDRRHTVNLFVSHRFSEKIDLSAHWTFATGGTASLPLRRTEIPDYSSFSSRRGDYVYRTATTTADYAKGRNNYRLPPTHRLNLSLNLHRRTRRGNEALWTFTLYNAYNAMNPDLVVFWEDRSWNEQERHYDYRQYLRVLTFLPILPSVSYTYNF